MNAWTSAAKDELNRFLTRIRQPLEQAGADAAEVIEDIRRHIDEEIAAARLRVVTVNELQPMLARIGEPWSGTERQGDKASAAQLLQRLKAEEPEPFNGYGSRNPPDYREPGTEAGLTSRPASEESSVAKKAKELRLPKSPFSTKPKPGIATLIFGVLLPFGTLVFEWITGFCASNIFDPIPSWAHLLLVALVPAANGMAWWAIQRDRDARFARYLSFGIGAALGVSIVYGIVFLPLAIPGIIALVVGIGLLPLTPYLALGSTIALRKVLKQRNENAFTGEGTLRFYPGLLTVLGVFGLMHLSFVGTNSLIRMASDPAKEKTALTMLKYFGSEKTILEACYTSNRRLGPSLFWLLDASRVEEEQARKVYFQLYGRAYNTVPKTGPRMFTAWDARADWDPERGGEKVGAPVPQLSMVSSRIDATVEPNAALGYLEWIVEFNNAGFANAEARCEIELPPGATVSRLTLWINGEEREAAFAGKAHVREAYQNVVVVQRRDPVLVTTSGRDRIMMQCFPVQPQQRMKMRLGLTVPLLLDADKNGILRWPYILERNFALDDKLEHSFWIDSPMPIESLSIPLKLERSASGHYMARGTLNERSNEVVQPAVLIRRDPSIDQAWANDTRANDGSVVEQRIMERPAAAFRNIVLVLDGSLAMAKIAERLSDTPLPFTKPLQVVVAGPEVKQFIAANAGELKRELRKIRFNGGQDNIPALEKAWDLAADNGPGAVLWMHGPQPVTISGFEGLKQRFERRQNAVQLFDLPIERAPNVITQTLPPWVRVELVSMHRPPADVLAEVLAQLRGSRKHYEFVRAKSQEGSAGAESNLHLARLWAFDEIHRLARSGDHQRAVELAALYQLVTEVSGAVVLETAEQYKQAGLQPVSPNSVPVVPEPGTWALLVVGAIVLLAYQRRRRTALRA